MSGRILGWGERRNSEQSDSAFKLAILYTVGFFGFLFSLLLNEVPAANGDMINQLVPVLSMIQGGIIQYFYQKSAQSVAEKKDDTIKSLAATASTTATTAATVAAGAGNGGKPPTSHTDTMDVKAENVQVTEQPEKPKDA